MNTPQPDKVKRIAVVGPESTGKTELARALGDHYREPWVPEFARVYLEKLRRPYHQSDLLSIARWQLVSEDELALHARRFLFCDTTLLVIKIWSEYRYGECDPEILELMNVRQYDHYLLTNIDMPWVDDPLREHPNNRDELFALYFEALHQQPVPFTVIRGVGDARTRQAIEVIDNLFINQSR